MSKTTIINAPIEQVQVMEDRAQIRRKLSQHFEVGHYFLEIEAVTPLLVEQSLRCQILSEISENRVLDNHLQRHYSVPTDADEKQLILAIESLLAQANACDDHFNTLLIQWLNCKHMVDVWSMKMQEQVATGIYDEQWSAQFESVLNYQKKLQKQLLDDQFSQDKRQQEWLRLLTEYKLVATKISEYKVSIVSQIVISEPGEYEVIWHYLVPCAVWRPTYTAHLNATGLDWQSSAMVWQITSEDWLNVSLSFSTERPSLGAHMPLLADDFLQYRNKTDDEKEKIAVSSQQQTIAKTSDVKAHYIETPGLDDGGEIRVYTLAQRVDVKSDGRPYRFIYERWQQRKNNLSQHWLCLPKKSPYVFLRSIQNNPTDRPLLAGPVDLNRDGNFVGRSQIGYVAKHDAFELSWGSDDNIVVMRDVTQQYKESKVLKERHYTFTFAIYIANYSDETRQITLMENLPISELEGVKIIVDKENSTPYVLDKNGIVHWHLNLISQQEKHINLAFKVLMPQKFQWNL